MSLQEAAGNRAFARHVRTRAPSLVGTLAGHSRPALQRRLIVNTPEKVDGTEWSAMVDGFVGVLRKAGSPLQDLVSAAKNPNFDLIITGDPKAGTSEDEEHPHLGITYVEAQLETSARWQPLTGLASQTLKKLHQNRDARFRVRVVVRFDPESRDLRNEELYTLTHEFAVHAAKYWPLLSNAITKKPVEPSLKKETELGGSFHAHTHHDELFMRQDPVHERLLADVWSHIMGKEIDEMLEIERTHKHGWLEKKQARVWKSDKFLQQHEVDRVTQLFGFLDRDLGPELKKQAASHRRFEKNGEPSAKVLKQLTGDLLGRVNAALETIRKFRARGGETLGQVDTPREERQTKEWSDVADEHFRLISEAHSADATRLRDNLESYSKALTI